MEQELFEEIKENSIKEESIKENKIEEEKKEMKDKKNIESNENAKKSEQTKEKEYDPVKLRILANIFDKEGISVEHCPTGIDTISIVLRSEFLDGKKEKIIEEIKNVLNPDILSIEEGISLIAVVGEGMSHHKELLMKIFEILAKENIQVKMIDQGSSGINVIIGISDNDFEKGLKALSLLQYEE